MNNIINRKESDTMDLNKKILIQENGDQRWYRTDFSDTLTKYAMKEDIHGTELKQVAVFYVETGDAAEYVVVDYDGANGAAVVYASTSYESVAMHIDIMKASKRFGD